MHRWKAVFFALLMVAGCLACTAHPPKAQPQQPQPSQCASQVGLVERAFADALAALALPAAEKGIPLERIPVRMLATRGPAIAAVTFVGGKLTVLYDRFVMEAAIRQFGYDAAVGIFAHELGHALNRMLELEDTELAADTWAGCAIGITVGRVESLTSLLATFPPDDSHPPAPARISATLEGYAVCLKALWEN